MASHVRRSRSSRPRKVPLTIKVDPSVKDRLRRRAERAHRTISSVAGELLGRHA